MPLLAGVPHTCAMRASSRLFLSVVRRMQPKLDMSRTKRPLAVYGSMVSAVQERIRALR